MNKEFVVEGISTISYMYRKTESATLGAPVSTTMETSHWLLYSVHNIINQCYRKQQPLTLQLPSLLTLSNLHLHAIQISLRSANDSVHI